MKYIKKSYIKILANMNIIQPPQANNVNELKLIEDKIKSLEEQIAQKENELSN